MTGMVYLRQAGSMETKGWGEFCFGTLCLPSNGDHHSYILIDQLLDRLLGHWKGNVIDLPF